MLFQVAEQFLSAPRIAPYLVATSNKQQAALELYLDNLQIAQCFYTPLAFLEIALRNSLDEVFSRFFQSPDWLITEQQGFMISPKLSYFNKKTKKQVTNDKILKMTQAAASEVVKQRGYLPTRGSDLIAELPFGFWTTLFTGDYARILLGRPALAFGYKPANEDSQSINGKLFLVRTFRNRIYHYEPLCLQRVTNKRLDFSQVQDVHKLIIDLLRWLNPDLSAWLATIDQLPSLIQQMRIKYPKAL